MNLNAVVFKSRYKQIAGMIIFVVASLSTAISVMRLIYFGIKDNTRIASVSYFKQSVYDIYRNTRFLDWFWENCPRPNLNSYIDFDNVFFIVIYYFVFVGIALYSSGRQIGKELAKVDDLNATSPEISDNSIFSQFHLLFIAPIVVTFMGAVVLTYLGLI